MRHDKQLRPTFGPSFYEVIEVNGNGLVLQRLSDKQIIRRHRDDVKGPVKLIKQVKIAHSFS